MKLIRQSEVYLMEEAVTDQIIKTAAQKHSDAQVVNLNQNQHTNHTVPEEDGTYLLTEENNKTPPLNQSVANKENIDYQAKYAADQPTNITVNMGGSDAQNQHKDGLVNVESYVKENQMKEKRQGGNESENLSSMMGRIEQKTSDNNEQWNQVRRQSQKELEDAVLATNEEVKINSADLL